MDLMEEKLESMLDRKFGPLKQSLDDVDHLTVHFFLYRLFLQLFLLTFFPFLLALFFLFPSYKPIKAQSK